MTRTKMKVHNRILHLNRACQYLFDCRAASLRNWPPLLSRILILFITIYWYVILIRFGSEAFNTFLFFLQTFVVVSKGKDIFRFSASKAMWLLDPFNPIRRVAIYILVHPLFSLFIITTILVNCILMIMPTTPTVESTE